MYIIMEFLSGGELFDIIARTGSISEADAALVTKCISSALKYLASKNIMHRDIKPENLLLKHEGDFRQVKLADFGFAYKSKEGTWYVGTGGYLAPELRQGKPYTDKVDTFALGCILYLMLSGQLPFGTGKRPLGFGESVLQHYKLAFPGSEFGGVSRQAKELIWSMLHTDASERWSASQVLRHRWLKEAAGFKNNLHTGAYAQRYELLQSEDRVYIQNNRLLHIAHCYALHVLFTCCHHVQTEHDHAEHHHDALITHGRSS
jgi:serine/threonine protein kinase